MMRRKACVCVEHLFWFASCGLEPVGDACRPQMFLICSSVSRVWFHCLGPVRSVSEVGLRRGCGAVGKDCACAGAG